MFRNFNLAAAILALLLYGYAQQQGWNMFDNVASPAAHGSSGGGRIYHK